MKNTKNSVKLVLPAAFAFAAFVFVTSYYFRENYCFEGPYFEKMCYGVWCISTGIFFSALSKRIKRTAIKLAAAILTSGIFTAAVFFANNFWTYICFNGEYRFDHHVPYAAFLKDDLLYNYAYGEFRYPLVFAIMLAVCIFVILRASESFTLKVKNMLEKAGEAVYVWSLSLESLDSLYCETESTEAAERLAGYIIHMPVNQESKKELVDCIDRYEDRLFYEVLFDKFGDVLERHEYASYRARYLKNEEKRVLECKEAAEKLTVSLPTVCRKLDEKFEIE